MVQILALVGAAALLAQTTLGAVVPARRTYDQNSYNNNNNNYNSGSNNGGSYQASNAYQQSSNQGSNNYNAGSNNYNSGSNNYNSGSNSYNNNNNYNMNQYQQQQDVTTTVAAQYNQATTTTSMMAEQTTMMMAEQTTMMMADTTTTSMMAETTVMAQEVTTTAASYSMPSYGSGSNSWNSGYNNCVQQCMAQFGQPPSSMDMQQSQDSLPPPTGTGAVHTIMVAPDGAGLRYMPFAVNASIGDTIRYVWTTPANHTATLSSALAICNKSGIADQRSFVSGVRNASAGISVFDVTVQTTEPQFFYCSVAQHCEKGMFGIINPTNVPGSTNTVGVMMNSMMQSNPQLQAAYSYMMQNISDSSAQNWGMSMSLDGIPASQYQEVAANVLFTQGTFALNPGMMESNQGAFNPDGSPIQFASGLNVLLSDTNAATPSNAVSGPASEATVTPAATGSLTPVNAYGSGNGALSARGVSTWLAVIVGVAGWLLI